MDYVAIGDIVEKLGIGAAAIVGIIYLTVYLTRLHAKQMDDIHRAFFDYVETNNHQKTDLVEKSTAAIVESTAATKVCTDLLKQMLDALMKK